MYLSCLLINVGDNPDHEDWRNRNWLRNLYRVHQRLAMAFPSDPRKKGVADLLKPYNPADFPDQAPADAIMKGKADVNEERSNQEGFLYRIDYGVPARPNGISNASDACPDGLPSRPVILVQSAKPPDWNYAFGLNPDARDPATGRPIGNAGHLLAAPPEVKFLNIVCGGEGNPSEPPPKVEVPPEVKVVNITFKNKDLLRFRLNANPTRRLASGPFNGNRVSVGRGRAAVLAWLWRKANDGGFDLVFEKGDDNWDPNWRVETGMVYAWKGREDDEKPKMSFACASIDGLLRITAPDRFRETLARGIGPAKAFGFGLLSIAPVR